MPIERREVFKVALAAKTAYDEPFLDVELEGVFRSPSGKTYVMPGFYDGDGIWRIRFSPNEAGAWSYQTKTQYPEAPGLHQKGGFEVTESEATPKGFLRTCPGRYWGLEYESGEPCFILGDTMYNLFGVAHCGLDVDTVLERRARQGFNLLRVRLPVSGFHPPKGYSRWQTRSTWPWGGSPQKPIFSQFNLDYFHSVDRVVARCAELGLGLEMIMEAWGFEYPFNHREDFTPEYEQLWMRYLIARYDAYRSVYVWTLQNEYEFYPDGQWRYNRDADLWAVRMARYVKDLAPHGHPVAVHNGPRLPPFAQRFRRAPGAIDLVMFQEWGTRDAEHGWLAAGIEDTIQEALAGWQGAFIFSEYGYERDPDLALRIPSHRYCGPAHTRRGGWRGAFCATGIIHGWEHTWGPWWIPETDQAGMAYLLHLRQFFTEIVPFHRLQPAPALIDDVEPQRYGGQPLALSTENRDVIALYLPVGGTVTLAIDPTAYRAQWYDPRNGQLNPAETNEEGSFQSDSPNREDWILVLTV